MFVKIKINDEERWISKKDFIRLFLNDSPDDSQFEEWWKLYDKKRAKVKTKKIFIRVINKNNIGQLMEHTRRYVKSTPDVQFRKDPSTYLNNECWNDEIISYVSREDELAAEEERREKIYIKRMKEKSQKVPEETCSEIPDLVSMWKEGKRKLNGK